jgi:hypothetical protein
MRALSIRQPYAVDPAGDQDGGVAVDVETIVGERFLIYACKAKATPVPIWSDDLRAGRPPAWMIELAEQVKLIEAGAILPTGVIVGSAIIERVTQRSEVRSQRSDEPSLTASSLTSDLCPLTSIYEWHLTDVKRAKNFRKPKGHPQPVWFRPF